MMRKHKYDNITLQNPPFKHLRNYSKGNTVEAAGIFFLLYQFRKPINEFSLSTKTATKHSLGQSNTSNTSPKSPPKLIHLMCVTF